MKKPMFLIAVLVAGLLAVALIGGAIAAPDTEQAKLTASDAAAGDQFGFSVAISGETAVVGASSVGSTGSAYVFVLDGGTWVQQAKLTASDAATGDEFGWSVAISGETIVVGARSDTTTAAGSGSAYVFVRTGSTWSQQAHLTAGDAGRGDSFGSSVAISDDTIVAGAPSDDDGGFNSGSAYVFVRTGSTWNQQDKLRASDATAGDRFAGSVAVSGDTAVTGAVQDDYQGTLTGSAYVFVRSGTTWTEGGEAYGQRCRSIGRVR